MTSDNERYRLIDATAAVDVGQGYSLAWVVDADGATWPVLYDTRQRATQFIPYLPEHFRDLAPHEMLGRLPEAFAQFRCGARTHAGSPCRQRVTGLGERCRFHLEAKATGRQASPRSADATLFDLEPGADPGAAS